MKMAGKEKADADVVHVWIVSDAITFLSNTVLEARSARSSSAILPKVSSLHSPHYPPEESELTPKFAEYIQGEPLTG
jgi:hypothetical protein